MTEESIAAAFHLQARFCRESGSELTAKVLEALIAVLDRSTRTGARILDWPCDPMVDALKLRIAGGLNALARSGRDADLAALYRDGDGNWEGELRRVLTTHDDWLFPWLDSAPQTNEVARSGLLWPGVMEIARRFGPRVELLELGASGGLNLNMDRFSYNLGGSLSGDSASAVKLAPAWNGHSPQSLKVDVIDRRGVDLNPLDLSKSDIADRMLAYIWPDQKERVARAEAAIRIAHEHPPVVDKADGANWVEARLAHPQPAGITRVIYHSIALQYFPPEGRARVKAAIEAAGERSSEDRPIAWLSMEFLGQVTQAALTLRCWPGNGTVEHLAKAHPHGATIEWLV